MLNIPANFVSKEKNKNKCICQQIENMEHLYKCKKLNEEKPEIQFEEIYRENIVKMKKIKERLEKNIDKKNEKEISHGIPYGDPPYSVTIEYGDG